MAVRWECPNSRHPAVLAPERPRKNDVRRYCLGLQKRWAWLTYGSVNRADGAYAADDRIRVQMEEYIKAGGEL